MRRKLQEAFSRWMISEGLGHLEAAEKGLVEVFCLLPRLVPSSGFAEAVLARVGLLEIPWGRRLFAHWSVKAAVALSLLLVGSAVALVPLGLLVLGPALHADRVVSAATRAVAGFLQWVVDGLVFWQVLADVGKAVAMAVATPQVFAVLALTTMMAAGALRLLWNLTARERSSFYVH